MEQENLGELTGMEKASMLLIMLGSHSASSVLQHLTPDEAHRLGIEIAKGKKVDAETQERILKELSDAQAAGLSGGGVDYAREVLEQALGPGKAHHYVQDIFTRSRGKPFDWVKSAGTPRLAKCLSTERPQVIALILAAVPPDQAAEVIAQLPEAVQGQVAYRLTCMQPVSPDIVKSVDDILKSRLAKEATGDFQAVGGLQSLVTILNNADRPTETKILDYFQKTEASIAASIREMMFTFEDLVNLDDRALQVLIREVEQEDLRLSLKGAPDPIKEAFFKNMSERAAEALTEDLEMMGPVKVRDVEAARRRLINTVRRLEESGQISLRQDDEDVVA